MAGVVVTMDGDEAKLYQAWQNVINQQLKAERGLEKVSGTSRKAAREQANLARAAKRVYDETRTPQERYNNKIRELNTLLQRTNMTQQTYARGVRDAKKELQDAGQAGKQAFGPGALGDLTRYVGGLVSAGTAIGTIVAAMRSMKEVRESAAARARESRIGMGSLAQLAKSPKEMKRLTGFAKGIHAGGGAETEQEAAQITFSMVSALGLERAEKNRELFTELKRVNLVESPAMMAKGAKTMMTTMGEKETGNFRDLISKAFGASQFSPATAEELLEAAAGSGPYAKLLGMRDESILAATALLATGAGSASEGGTRLKALMKGLYEAEEFKGKSLRESLVNIQQRKLTPKQFKDLLGGRAEARIAYETLTSNLPQLDEAVKEVDLAQSEDRVGKQLQLYKVDRSLRAAVERETAKRAEEASARPLGTISNLADEAVSKYATDVRTGKIKTMLSPEWDIALTKIRTGIKRFLPGGDELVLKQSFPNIRDSGLRGRIAEQITIPSEVARSGVPYGVPASTEPGGRMPSFDYGEYMKQAIDRQTDVLERGNRLVEQTNQRLERIESKAEATGRSALAGPGNDPEGR